MEDVHTDIQTGIAQERDPRRHARETRRDHRRPWVRDNAGKRLIGSQEESLYTTSCNFCCSAVSAGFIFRDFFFLVTPLHCPDFSLLPSFNSSSLLAWYVCLFSTLQSVFGTEDGYGSGVFFSGKWSSLQYKRPFQFDYNLDSIMKYSYGLIII